MSGEADHFVELIDHCLSGDESAWTEFVRQFQPVIAMGAIRVGRLYGETGRDTLDDLIQQTYVKICAHDCRILRQFAGKSANDLRAYLRVVAANVARDHFSARFPDRNAVSLDALVELSQSGVGSQSSVEFDTLIQQIDTLIERIPGQNKTRDRTVFWLYYRAGLTSKAIAAIPAVGMTTKGVESILQRLVTLVRHAMAPGGDSGAAKGTAASGSVEEGGCDGASA